MCYLTSIVCHSENNMVHFLRLLIFIFLVSFGFSCPDYWTSFQESCYDLIQNPSTWAGAAEICQQFDSQLVAVETVEENNFLNSFAKSENVGGELWLGGNDLMSEDHWMWQNGEALSYTNWPAGEPSNSGGVENCMEASSTRDFRWNDIDCSKENYFICEKQASTNPMIG